MLSSKLIATIAIISIAVSVSSAADTVGNKQRTLLKTRKGRRNNIKVENVMNEEDVVFFTRTLQGGSLPPSGGGGTAPGTMEPVPATPLPTDMVRIFDIYRSILHVLCVVVDAYSYYYIHAQYIYIYIQTIPAPTPPVNPPPTPPVNPSPTPPTPPASGFNVSFFNHMMC